MATEGHVAECGEFAPDEIYPIMRLKADPDLARTRPCHQQWAEACLGCRRLLPVRTARRFADWLRSMGHPRGALRRFCHRRDCLLLARQEDADRHKPPPPGPADRPREIRFPISDERRGDLASADVLQRRRIASSTILRATWSCDA